MKQQRVPRVLAADKMKSYPVAHRARKGLNNRAENSHQPTRNANAP
jgi:putative transposase